MGYRYSGSSDIRVWVFTVLGHRGPCDLEYTLWPRFSIDDWFASLPVPVDEIRIMTQSQRGAQPSGPVTVTSSSALVTGTSKKTQKC